MLLIVGRQYSRGVTLATLRHCGSVGVSRLCGNLRHLT
jgi:hypothetical protein